MAHPDHPTPVNLELHPRRFLAAALSALVLVVMAMVSDALHDGFALSPALGATARIACATLIICAFVVHLIDRIVRWLNPEALAYAMGYVDGVARRFPGEDRVHYTRQ